MERKKSIILDGLAVISLQKLLTDLNNEASSEDHTCDWSTLVVDIDVMTEGILLGATVITATVQSAPTQ